MKDTPSAIQFPCEFPIKIVGKHTDRFVKDIVKLTQKHFPEFSPETIKHQPSKQKTYLSLTLTVHVKDKATLDALYRDLTAHPDSKMVL